MRLQITVNDDLVKKIDKYAKMVGISRSAMCALWIGQGVVGYEKAEQIMNNNTMEFLKNATTTK